MKKLSITFLVAMTVASAAMASDLQIIQKDNGHGQTISLYQRTGTETVTLFRSGQSVGIRTHHSVSRNPSVQYKDNAHGQPMSLFRQD